MSERTDPLRTMYREAEAAFTTFPPPDSVFAEAHGAVDAVAGFGDPEAERAALHEGGALLDLPWKRIIQVTGDERLEFLNRMVTQELKGLSPGQAVNSFWLNRKGRIVADLRILHFERETLLEVDAPVKQSTLESLQSYIIVEDVELTDASSSWRSFAIVGPRSHAWLRAGAGAVGQEFPPGAVIRTPVAGVDVIADRDETLGSGALRLLVPSDHVIAAHRHVLESGASINGENAQTCRMVGWEAFHAFRIASGRPTFLVDFGTASLPHESGALRSRVSFTKGCFLGQEVVARMHSLGQPKQKCVRLRIDAMELPGPGAKLFPAEPIEGDAIGVITGAALSDDGAFVNALAQVKTRFASVGTPLRLHEGARVTVEQALDS